MSLVMLDWMAPEVAWIRFNDPDRLNAMGEQMALDFGALLESLRTRPLRAVVLSGEGKAFSAGGDLAMLESKQSRSWERNRSDMLAFYRTFLGLLDLHVPLIAAVHGWAVGAGCCLMAACDIRLADPGARFRVPFLSMGLFPGMGSTHWFPQRMGPWASEFLLTGSTLNAEQAALRGLVTGLSEPGLVLELARQQVERVLLNGPEVTRDLLAVLRQDVTPALICEADLQARSYNRPEFAERLKKC
ncbi:enoyl-CoA hydratase/isomerase family protein [bacterium]|nr:enoyl-CoA hydratase/isomerase family protein [bacterium]